MSTPTPPYSADDLPHLYSVPKEAQRLLWNGILRNPLISAPLPAEIQNCAKHVEFQGFGAPSIPINWRFAESVAALKGLEAAMVMALVGRKYGGKAQRAVVDTDHAQLFIMSVLLWTLDPSNENINHASALSTKQSAYHKYFRNTNFHQQGSSFYRTAATNIYRCADGKYFQLHGSMNADPTITSVDLPIDPGREFDSPEDAWSVFAEAMGKIESAEMQRRASEVYKQAGTICYTSSEYAQTEHGKANSGAGLFSLSHHSNPKQKPGWWPDHQSKINEKVRTGPERPLAGLKVLDLTRVIAAPAVTRGLAEYGASILRVTAPHLPDMETLHCELNWGKWNTSLDFRSPSDVSKMRALVLEADVVVSGYRPGVLDKFGFGYEGLMRMCEGRDRGLIVVRENCYGWEGEWMGRSGWQQVSDACCGTSWGYGKAMGLDEPVCPVFPNSDFCTGVIGVVGTLAALVERAEKGGSWRVDISLNAYSQFLTSVIGAYPLAVWSHLWTRHGSPVFRHYHNMQYTIPRIMSLLKENCGQVLFKDEFLEERFSGAIGKTVRCLRPVIRFEAVEGGEEEESGQEGGVGNADGCHCVKLGFNVGTRGNGVDAPRWPEDLGVEVIT